MCHVCMWGDMYVPYGGMHMPCGEACTAVGGMHEPCMHVCMGACMCCGGHVCAVCIVGHTCAMCVCRGQRSTCKSYFYASTMWVPEAQLRLSVLAASTFIHWVTSNHPKSPLHHHFTLVCSSTHVIDICLSFIMFLKKRWCSIKAISWVTLMMKIHKSEIQLGFYG